MRVVLSIGNIIIISLVSFLGIIALVGGFRKAEKVPLVGPLAKGAVDAWTSTAVAA